MIALRHWRQQYVLRVSSPRIQRRWCACPMLIACGLGYRQCRRMPMPLDLMRIPPMMSEYPMALAVSFTRLDRCCPSEQSEQ